MIDYCKGGIKQERGAQIIFFSLLIFIIQMHTHCNCYHRGDRKSVWVMTKEEIEEKMDDSTVVNLQKQHNFH